MPPSIATRIVDELRNGAARIEVAEVRIGLGYTAVTLTDGRAGVAYTFRDEAKGGCSVFRGRRPLAGQAAAHLLELLPSDDRIEAAVGLACANALANTADVPADEGDVIAHLAIRSDDDVAMVGRFGPLIEELEERARSLTIVEQSHRARAEERSSDKASEIIGRSQVALITSTAIINHTIDSLLEAASSCREVALVGASTPLLQRPFEGTAVTLLSGIAVDDSAGVLQVVSEGGGMRQFKRFARKICVRAAS